ncbi:MAG: serine/threonine protein kinase [Deltaproteobacteria bacterium]|nr:MAG: serine/threonine protein kinase [Deltaproteobacteria bacterium]
MEIHILGGLELVDAWPPRTGPIRSFRARPAGAGEDAPITHFVKVRWPERGEADALRAAQFAHEADLLERLNHPAIPTLHDRGEQAGLEFFAMDYIDGVALRDLVFEGDRDAPGLSRPQAVFVAAQIADALRHVHDLSDVGPEGDPVPLNALHRDVTPDNIVIDTNGDATLVDFSIADSDLLAPRFKTPTAGTLGYMAPERLRDPPHATPRSDLFALAVVLWEMIRGERCFPGQDRQTVLDAVMGFDMRRTTHRIPGLSSRLSEVLRKNLDPTPERRFESAYDVLRRLSQATEAADAERARAELGARVRRRLGREE